MNVMMFRADHLVWNRFVNRKPWKVQMWKMRKLLYRRSSCLAGSTRPPHPALEVLVVVLKRRTLPAVISLSAKEEEVLKQIEAAVSAEAEAGHAAAGEWEVAVLIETHREMASEIGIPEMGSVVVVDMEEEETSVIRVVSKAVEGIVAAGLDMACALTPLLSSVVVLLCLFTNTGKCYFFIFLITHLVRLSVVSIF
ncbi:hypothetical protein ANCCAN_16533 [Ancylostoma caninum]|uniref:Uncharacterized protein n=1 Tax=Ancylostoma caninum TaxID=29170 RepID=A0A368G1J4_ANCCA|nr:hypothetical protein ANCCAN_16533 [Ancylostoma caninum]